MREEATPVSQRSETITTTITTTTWRARRASASATAAVKAAAWPGNRLAPRTPRATARVRHPKQWTLSTSSSQGMKGV